MNPDLHDLLSLKDVDTPDVGHARVGAVHARIATAQKRRVALTISGSVMALAIVVAFVFTSIGGGKAAPRPGIPASQLPTPTGSVEPSGVTSTSAAPPSNVAVPAAIRSWSPLPGGRDRGTGGLNAWVQGKLITSRNGCCGGDRSTDVAMFDPATGAWTDLPNRPGASRMGGIGIGTPDGMIVLGGHLFGDPHGSVFPRDVYRIDPRTKAWTRLADLPDSDEVIAAVWTGSRVLALLGAPEADGFTDLGSNSVLATYDPAHDSWTPNPTGGVPVLEAQAVWTGSELLVVGGTTRGPTSASGIQGELADPGRSLWSYSPASGRWTQLPDAPVSARTSEAVAWTGTGLFVWGGEAATTVGGTSTGAAGGAEFDIASRTWRTIATSPLRAGINDRAFWDGHDVIVYAPSGSSYGLPAGGVPLPRLAGYDPASDAWSVLPEPTGSLPGPAGSDASTTVAANTYDYAAAVWTGTRLFLLGGGAPGDQCHCYGGWVSRP